MNEYQSLDHFKEKQKISDNSGGEISYIFNELFYKFMDEDLSNDKQTKSLLDSLLEECKEVTPTLIPYSEITNIIFAAYFYNGKEHTFPEKFKSEFEKRIVKKFSKQADINHRDKIPKNNDELFYSLNRNDGISLVLSDEYEDAILVVYKIIQHTELAISQKQSLYENLKNQIDYLDESLDSATSKYDNMMSNFISILGIFAAIMMATFGAIQGFTAIYSNENDYNLTTIIIISCFGLFALVSVVYLLLYTVSRLIDKELSDNYYSKDLFVKFPLFSHIVLVIFVIFLLALNHLFKISPPNYLPAHFVDNIWSYTILAIILIILAYSLHLLVDQSRGYCYLNRHINKYIMNTKNKLGLEKLLNIILIIITVLVFVVIAYLVYNIII